MSTLADNVIALQAAVVDLTAKVEALPSATPVDLSSVLTAVAGVDADVKAVLIQVSPTPTA